MSEKFNPSEQPTQEHPEMTKNGMTEQELNKDLPEDFQKRLDRWSQNHEGEDQNEIVRLGRLGLISQLGHLAEGEDPEDLRRSYQGWKNEHFAKAIEFLENRWNLEDEK